MEELKQCYVEHIADLKSKEKTFDEKCISLIKDCIYSIEAEYMISDKIEVTPYDMLSRGISNKAFVDWLKKNNFENIQEFDDTSSICGDVKGVEFSIPKDWNCIKKN